MPANSDQIEPRSPARASTRGLSVTSLALLSGLGVFGASSFILLGLAGRELGPAGSAPLSVAWTAVNAVGIGLFMPVEQEVSRLTAARRATVSLAPTLTHVTRYVLWALAVTSALTLFLSQPLANLLFSGEITIVRLTAVALAAVGLEYYVRGSLSGSGLFVRYGTQLMIDGGARIVIALAVFLGPWDSAAAYGVALVVSPAVATLLTVSIPVLGWMRKSPTKAHASSIAPLVLTSLSSQLLANAGPLAIAALSTSAQEADTGRFVAAVTVGRIPLFLFAAIQAVFLPTLAGLVTRADIEGFRRTFRKAWTATAAIGLLGTAGVAFLGQWVIRVIYGPDFDVNLLDLLLIALSGSLFMASQVLAQALLAHRQDTLVLVGWTVGLLVTGASLALPIPLTTRVATALVAGAAASSLVMVMAYAQTMTAWARNMTPETRKS